MRKVISVVLTALMLLSLIAVGTFSTTVLAAEGGNVDAGYTPAADSQAVSSAAEFAAMQPNGKYHLTADIQIDTTYATEFTGTFDGNGKTVTVSVPMFASLKNATVKNLKTAGAIDWSSKTENCAAVASVATTSTFLNIANSATVKGAIAFRTETVMDPVSFMETTVTYRTATAGIVAVSRGTSSFTDCSNSAAINGMLAAGIVAFLEKEQVETGATAPAMTLTFKNCFNEGKITDDGANTEEAAIAGCVAGVAAYIGAGNTTVTAENCDNSGEITSTGKSAQAGGVFGYLFDTDICTTTFTIKDCDNDGAVTGRNQTGGVMGWPRCAMEAENCHNRGDVASTSNYAGGVFGRVAAENKDSAMSASNSETNIRNCSNSGEVLSFQSQVGGIVGYSKYPVSFYDCSNSGKVGPLTDIQTCESNMAGGGIAGAVNQVASFERCVNTGSVTGNYRTGGIVGRVGCSGGVGQERFYYCVSAGNVYSTGTEPASSSSSHSTLAAGGLFGYAYGSGATEYPVAWYNAVTCNIVDDNGIAGGIGGYFNTANASVQCNYVIGEITCTNGLKLDDSKTLSGVYGLFWNNKNEARSIYANYFLSTKLPKMLTYQNGVETDLSSYEWICTPEEVVNGTLCYNLNKEAEEYAFFQRLSGADADAMPVFDESHGYVLMDENGNLYNASEAPTTEETTTEEVTSEEEVSEEVTTEGLEEVEVTTAGGEEATTAGGGETTKAPSGGDDAQGGCKSAIGASVAAVLLLMVAAPAVLLKKKED